jgi:hypothetical protein
MKKQKLIPVKVYFSDADFVKRLENISRQTGISLSGVTAQAVRMGIVKVEEMFLEPSQLSVPKKKEVARK